MVALLNDYKKKTQTDQELARQASDAQMTDLMKTSSMFKTPSEAHQTKLQDSLKLN